MRVLVIDSEADVGTYVKKGLEESGCSVDLATDGVQGLLLVQETPYDVIVLDVMLPVIDGWTVLTRLHEMRATPVLFLTARSDVADRVKCFALGGDDYMVKPFSFAELLTRIRMLARRGLQHRVEMICIADLEIDLIYRYVKRGPVRIGLTPREFSVLQALAQRQGQILSRAQIALIVWGADFESNTNFIEVAIRRLRSKIDRGFPKRLIHTIRGVGYMMGDLDTP